MRFTLVPILLCLIVLITFSNATIYGWGKNDQGQLGLGSKVIVYTPAPIPFFNNFVMFDILTATNYAIFVCTNGTVYGTGLQYYGQFASGITSTNMYTTPSLCPSLNRSLDIVLSGTSCNANYKTNLLGWGNVAGYVQAKTTGSYPKIQIASSSLQFDGKVLSVHSVQEGVIVRLGNNTVYAAGNNGGGRLGTGGDATTTYNFVQVPFWRTTSLQTIYSSQSKHVCGLSVNRSLYCWGQNDYGQLGVGDTSSYLIPTLVHFFDDNKFEIYKVVYGDSHTVVLTCGGRVFAFGANAYGQLGQVIPDSGTHPTPKEVTNDQWNSDIADVITGIYQTYVRTNNGRWFVWGGGKSGSLGLNSSMDSYLPTENNYLKGLNINRIRSSSQSYNFYGWYDDSVTNDKLSCPILVNECLTGNNRCDPNALCTDYERGYGCDCANGFEGDGFTCVNVDSCQILVNFCDPNATCTDLPSGPECDCNDGFQGDGSFGNCTDINECLLGNPCAVNAKCINLVPMYTCQCNDGFAGDPFFDGCSRSCNAGQYAIGSACVDCPAGFYTESTQATHCIPCPAGTFSETGGLNSSQGCARCDVGGYSGLGATYCSLCIHGYTNDPSVINIDNSTCFACPIGTYGYYGKCIGCAAGMYSDQPIAQECRNCLPGYSAENTANFVCQPCDAGYSSRGGTSDCTICPAGYYSKKASKDCLKCAPGTSTNGNYGQQNCTACPAGTFTGKAAAQNCFNCPAGYFTNTTGASFCQRCPRGTFSSASGSSSCLSCPSGLYSAGTAATKCLNCDSGLVTYDGITCVPCGAGTYYDSQTRACIPCAPGTFVAQVGQTTSCYSCAAGTFASESGASYCKRCPVNTYSDSTTGFSSCTPCPPGMKNNGGSSSCSI